MDTVTIQFTDVGAGKKSWTADLPRPLTHHSLFKSVKANHALGSLDIDFAENGAIYVGMCRRVGSWSVVS